MKKHHKSGGRTASKISINDIRANVSKLTKGTKVTAEEIARKSPIPIPTDLSAQTLCFLSNAFGEDDFINIVYSRRDSDEDGGVIYRPGSAHTASLDTWHHQMGTGVVPASDGGMWILMNPVCKDGSGKSGFCKDSDVTAFRYGLLECDELTIDDQLSLFSSLSLPIFSLTTSGARSIHALVTVHSTSVEEYKKTMKILFHKLRFFGVDCANSNPSRMTRLPGVSRTGNGVGDKLQTLLYLNPNPECRPILTN